MIPLGGGFKHLFFIFTPLFGEDEPILTYIFQVGWFNDHHREFPTFGLNLWYM